jgi:hypothetical protein
MSIFRYFRYRRLLNTRQRQYASLAMSLALAHASFGQVKYKSLGNGMADIELSLGEDQEFKLQFNRLDEAKEYIMKGKWTVEDDRYVLKFRRTRLDVPSLFSSNGGLRNPVVIEDKHTVKFPSGMNGITIWGIYCPASQV